MAPIAPPSPTPTPSPSSTSSPVATPFAGSRSATFAIPVPDADQVTGTVILSLPAGWTAAGAYVDGLTGRGAVLTTMDGSNTLKITFMATQVADRALVITLTGVGPWVDGDVATADASFDGAAEQLFTAPLV